MPSLLTKHMAARRKEAADALAELLEALAAAGIVLPSVSIDWRSPCTGFVLIELGSARADVIRHLAAVIRSGNTHAHC
ncbi:hypothetical protein [Kitasatospora mediocidica]|uniref:hypothetical protein n=1 Tax=Kitasatospora mediocidica TaxID=58352 RepID=UPI00056BDC43|nr:hypothetical protein [Kitasatospora mediocidica]